MLNKVPVSVFHSVIDHPIEAVWKCSFVVDIFGDDSPAVLSVCSQVMYRTARLVAQWQCVGFCHGVLNTDNMSVLGLTLDYGPYGFMDRSEMRFNVDELSDSNCTCWYELS